jgi:IMP dehydrogenase/GMP reductase
MDYKERMKENRQGNDRFNLHDEFPYANRHNRDKIADGIHQLIEELRNSMEYCGTKDIPTFWEKTEFVKITSAELKESHVYDITITKEVPNYHQWAKEGER